MHFNLFAVLLVSIAAVSALPVPDTSSANHGVTSAGESQGVYGTPALVRRMNANPVQNVINQIQGIRQRYPIEMATVRTKATAALLAGSAVNQLKNTRPPLGNRNQTDEAIKAANLRLEQAQQVAQEAAQAHRDALAVATATRDAFNRLRATLLQQGQIIQDLQE